MKRMVALTALLSGLLLLVVPRYILPACEYEGYPRMHCSDTAKAEFLIGAVLMVIGGISLFSKKNIAAVVAAVACVLYAVAYWLPDKIGYCHSTRMPCNYGMVPGIRFISIAGALLMIVAVAGLLKKSRERGTP
jgi:hypothetical protein